MNNSRGLLLGVGAAALLAFGASVLESSKNPDVTSKSQGISEGVNDKVEAVLGVEEIDGDEDTVTGEIKSGNNIKAINLVVRLAKTGSLESAKLVMQYYDANPDKTHEEILQELGISDDTYKTFKNAVDFDYLKGFINNKDGMADEITEEAEGDENFQFMGGSNKTDTINFMHMQGMLRLLCEHADTNGGDGYSDILFLQLIGMNGQELKDVAMSIHSYFADNDPKGIFKENLAYLNQVYGLDDSANEE